ncbi:hypothetical protein M404DRAFT_825811 [Pisolithus tinctorius Marx 270]|uniref:F-box domain-containing protein n=1 Tax=Pisolithus tinctorius Marx 270 TaxID=870435 RepID=A0A0C3NUK5_PISTI|nr:hypothetical protein M404DRAFT_825811 [Pisolithus tinctorius Marx 270]
MHSSSAIENAMANPEMTDELVDRFLDVQTDKVTSGTVNRSLVQIDALPVELLTQMLHDAILADTDRCEVHRHRKQELACVSRCWRDTIFNNPFFWTTILVTPQWAPSLVEAHVQRSGRLLVAIQIKLWQPPA